jgi:D-alanyl-D-alanine carboxypeptidase
MSPRRLLLVAALAPLMLPAPAVALPTAAELRRDARALVDAGAPGVIVLARDGSRSVRAAAGSADLTPRTPMRATDRFRVASISKTFVAAVALQLAGEGKMALDDTVERWVPGLVPGGAGITVRQLLNHSSGLFDYIDDGDDTILKPYVAGEVTHVTPPRQIVEVATKHPPHFSPGTRHKYSNTNYIVLGLVVEAVAGESLTAELGRRIFQPLGLQATSFDAAASRISGRHAHGYSPLGPNGKVIEVDELNSSLTWAAGGLVSTAGDVARFYRALLGGRLVRPDLLREMQATLPAGPPGEGYGLGLFRTRRLDVGPGFRLPCAKSGVWGHDGNFAGWVSYAYNSLDGRRQMVVLINTDSLPAKGSRALGRLYTTAFCG